MDVVVRAAAIYLIVLTLMRVSGRRTFAESQPFDLVLVFLIAETAGEALAGDDRSITNAVVLIVTLVLMDIGFSHLKRRSRRFSLWLDGAPTAIIVDRNLDADALRRSRLTLDDILQEARRARGVTSLSDIEHAILEIDGSISVITRRDLDGPRAGE